MIPKPFLVYGLAAAIISGFLAGWTVKDWQCDAAYAKALEKAEKERTAMQAKLTAASKEYQELLASLEPARVETRNSIREIYKNVEVPSNCAPPTSAVSLLEGARERTNAAASGRLSSTVQ